MSAKVSWVNFAGFAASLCVVGLLGVAAADAPGMLRVVVGQSRIETMPGITQVAIGDARIADVKALNDSRQLMLTGLRAGMTTLSIWRNGEKEDFLVRVMDNDPRLAADDLSEILRDVPGVRVEVVGQRVMIEGRVVNADDFTKVGTVADLYPEALNFVEPNHVDLDQMVRIEVYLLEIDRSATTQIGVDWPDAVGGSADLSVAGNLVPGIGPFSGTVALTSQLSAALNLMMQNGTGRVLSNPTLVTKNGKSAHFHAGGSIPVPVVASLGQTTVEWKPFGIRVELLPHVDQEQNFNLELSVEVSDLDFGNAVESSAGTIPALRSRSTASVVNLTVGESLVLAELVDRKEGKVVAMVPGLGQLPILGELFRTRSVDRRDTEIYLVATPSLVRPGSIDRAKVQDRMQRYEDASKEIRPELME